MQRLRELLKLTEQAQEVLIRDQGRVERVRELMHELEALGVKEVDDRLMRPLRNLLKNRGVMKHKVRAGLLMGKKIGPAGKGTPGELKVLLTRLRDLAVRDDKEFEGLVRMVEEELVTARKRIRPTASDKNG